MEAHHDKIKTTVILANLGAPGQLHEVRPFLKNLFNDPDIFNFPFGKIGQDFFSSMIAYFRSIKSRKYYAAIGGGSPLHRNTVEQAEKLESALKNEGNYKVVVVQRYWTPMIGDVINQLELEENDRVIILPLYPHYSNTTTRSIFNEWNRHWKGRQQLIRIERFYDHPIYIKACVEKIKSELKKLPRPPHLLFSAHSIPLSYVNDGDPYQTEIENNMEMIMTELGGAYSFSLCYQSRVGPVKWLGPSFEDEVNRLLMKDKKDILIFPISFVSEHLETLYELDMQKKAWAKKRGIKIYARADTVQSSKLFIETLKDLVLKI
ncbi:MAG: ferrochelatase [Candidatus Neomarinimicrobiota bacterium]